MAKMPSTDANFKKYLNDGRFDLGKNAIKIHLDGILNSEVSAIYERKLSPAWSIEAGGGIIPRYLGINEMVMGGFGRGDSTMSPFGIGYSYQVMPKFYYTWGAIDQGGYCGLLFKQRHFKNGFGNKIKYTEVGMMWGVQMLVNKKLCLDFGYGFGFASYKVEKAYYDSYTDKYEASVTPVLAQHLRFGIGIFFGKDPLADVEERSKKPKKGDSEDE